MGGDVEPRLVNDLAWHVKRLGLLTCWYSGREKLSPDIDIENFNFIKLGPYIPKYGPLNVETTNQKFYEVQMSRELDESGNPVYGLMDITDIFLNKSNE